MFSNSEDNSYSNLNLFFWAIFAIYSFENSTNLRKSGLSAIVNFLQTKKIDTASIPIAES
jgi:hypothetical protein